MRTSLPIFVLLLVVVSSCTYTGQVVTIDPTLEETATPVVQEETSPVPVTEPVQPAEETALPSMEEEPAQEEELQAQEPVQELRIRQGTIVDQRLARYTIRIDGTLRELTFYTRESFAIGDRVEFVEDSQGNVYNLRRL